MRRGHWLDIEIEILQVVYPDRPMHELERIFERLPSSIYARAKKLGLAKSDAFLASPASGRMRPGSRLGGNTRFKPGMVPANKGLRRPGFGPGRMKETQFKKGCLSGRAKQRTQLIGAERLSKDGYLQRKVNNDLPMQARWRAVHILVWEAANGPLPKGHCIVFRDGDRKNVAIGNLVLITRAQNMQRNSVHNLPEPLPELIHLRGVLVRKINRRTRISTAKGCDRSTAADAGSNPVDSTTQGATS